MPMQSHAQFVCVITLITCVLVVIVTTDGIWMHEWSLVHAKPRRIPHQGNCTCKLNVYLAHPALQSAACSAGAGAASAGGCAKPVPGLREPAPLVARVAVSGALANTTERRKEAAGGSVRHRDPAAKCHGQLPASGCWAGAVFCALAGADGASPHLPFST